MRPDERPLTGALEPHRAGGWRYARWPRRIGAVITDRRADAEAVIGSLAPASCVEAEQVHGAGIAVIAGPPAAARLRVPGCDGLITAVPGVALAVRTADCLPVLLAEPVRGVVGLAHAGWRGLAAGIAGRLAGAALHECGCDPGDLHAAIGPGIRSCCYEVGPEFGRWFAPHMQERGGRLFCDLTGAVRAQLERAGVRPGRIHDTGRCTACEMETWFSLRREGQETGRLVSCIMYRP